MSIIVKIKERFFIMADAYNEEALLRELIIGNSNISKHQSDKMKAHIANLSGIGKAGYIQVTLDDIY